VDIASGEAIGRALIVVWRGKIHIIGLDVPVVPVFVPQTRITYWKQELGFTIHAAPDFPGRSAAMLPPSEAAPR
jgi:hypothetical protein